MIYYNYSPEAEEQARRDNSWPSWFHPQEEQQVLRRQAVYAGRLLQSSLTVPNSQRQNGGHRSGMPFVLVACHCLRPKADMPLCMFNRNPHFLTVDVFRSAFLWQQLADAVRIARELATAEDFFAAVETLARTAPKVLQGLNVLSMRVLTLWQQQADAMKTELVTTGDRHWNATNKEFRRRHVNVQHQLSELLNRTLPTAETPADASAYVHSRGSVESFLRHEGGGTRNATTNLFHPGLPFPTFLHDRLDQPLLTLSPKLPDKFPNLTLPQWLAVARVHLRAEMMTVLQSGSGDGFATTVSVSRGSDKDGFDRVFFTRISDATTQKLCGLWLAPHEPPERFVNEKGEALNFTRGNLAYLESLSQDRMSCRVSPATRDPEQLYFMKVLDPVHRFRWEYEALAAACDGEGTPAFRTVAGFPAPASECSPISTDAAFIDRATLDAKLKAEQAVVFRQLVTSRCPVLSLSSPAGAGKSRVVTALIHAWTAELDRLRGIGGESEAIRRPIVWLAVSKPVLRPVLMDQLSQTVGQAWAGRAIMIGIGSADFEYLTDYIASAEKAEAARNLAAMARLDEEIAQAKTMEELMDAHVSRHRECWRCIQVKREAREGALARVDIVISTTTKLLKEIAGWNHGVFKDRFLDCVFMDEVQQERAMTVMAVVGNAARHVLLAHDWRQRFIMSASWREPAENQNLLDASQWASDMSSTRSPGGDQLAAATSTAMDVRDYLRRKEGVLNTELNTILRQGQMIIALLRTLDKNEYRLLSCDSDNRTYVSVIPFMEPDEWASVASDLPSQLKVREAGFQRVYRHKTLFLAIAALATNSILNLRTCFVLVLTDRMRRALACFLRRGCGARGPAGWRDCRRRRCASNTFMFELALSTF